MWLQRACCWNIDYCNDKATNSFWDMWQNTAFKSIDDLLWCSFCTELDAFCGQVSDSGTQTRSFQYVSDLVSGLISLMNSNYSQPVNLGNPQEYTINEMAQIVRHLTGMCFEFVFRRHCICIAYRCGLLLLTCRCACVCPSRGGILQKRLDHLRCRLACGLGWALLTMY